MLTAAYPLAYPGTARCDDHQIQPFDKWLSLLAGADAVSVDASGQIYLMGLTFGGLPTTPNAIQLAPWSTLEPTGFLLKLNSAGSQVLYGTYLNGLYPHLSVTDQDGFIYILADHPKQNIDGTAVSFPAPVSGNAAQTYPGTFSTPTLLKIAPDGTLVYATFLGGLSAVSGGALAVDSRGSAVVCGSTLDPTLPVSPGAFQSVPGGGYDLFIARVSPDGTAYDALTYLGGGGAEICGGLRLDPIGNVYVYGYTTSRFYPVTPGAYQTVRGAGANLFAAKLDPAMHSLIWSTYLGGNWDTYAEELINGALPGTQEMAFTSDGGLAFAGTTQASDYPVSPDTAPEAGFTTALEDLVNGEVAFENEVPTVLDLRDGVEARQGHLAALLL